MTDHPESDERLRRPELDRREPIRTLAGGVYDRRYGSASGRPDVSTDPSRPVDGVDGVEGVDSAAGARHAQRCVEAGYAIADENVRSGRAGNGPWAATDFQSLSGQMVAAASDLGQLWFQLVQSMMTNLTDFGAAGLTPGLFAGGMFPGAAGASPPGHGEGASGGFPGMVDLGPEPEPWLSDRLAVRIKIESELAAEIAVQLHPGARGKAMVAGTLSAVKEGQPLSGLSVRGSDPDELSLSLVVPPGQTAGLYHGVLFEPNTGTPLGTVTVRLE